MAYNDTMVGAPEKYVHFTAKFNRQTTPLLLQTKPNFGYLACPINAPILQPIENQEFSLKLRPNGTLWLN